MSKEGYPGGAIGVVFQPLDDAGRRLSLPLEVNDAVDLLGSATAVPGCDPALVVAAASLAHAIAECFEGPASPQVFSCGCDPAS